MLIFSLAAQHGQWIAARQAAAASNIANANTPGYRSTDVASFEQIFDRTRLDMTATHTGHMQPEAARFERLEMQKERSWDVSYSGNDVTLETELMKIAENGRMVALDTNIVRTFQRMFLASLKVA